MSAELVNRIRVLRAERRLSQSELADLIGVTRKTINTIEVGRFVPSTIIALKIARQFGVAVEDVFSLSEPSNEPATPTATESLPVPPNQNTR